MTMLFEEGKYTTDVERIITKSHAGTDRVIYTITLTPLEKLNRADFTIVFDDGTKREEM